MLRMVNLLMALSLGVHLEQLEQRTGLTWPLPFLLRPLQRKQWLALALGDPEILHCAREAVLGRSLLDHLCDLRRVGSAGSLTC